MKKDLDGTQIAIDRALDFEYVPCQRCGKLKVKKVLRGYQPKYCEECLSEIRREQAKKGRAKRLKEVYERDYSCLLYTSPSPRD